MRIDDDREGPTAARAPSSDVPHAAGVPPLPATATSKDVARLAGVSQSTVSYVLTGRRPISAATRERVLDAMARLTYEPHAGARALAGSRTGVLGLAAPLDRLDRAGALMAFAEEIALTARRHDHDVLLLTSAEGPEALRRIERRSLCDGAVVMQVRAQDDRVAVARDLRMPVVFIGVPDDRDGLHCVDVDFAAAARLLVDEVGDAGARDVVVLGWDEGAERVGLNFVDRFRAAARERAAHHGAALVWRPVPGTRDGVGAALDAVLPADGDPPALVVTHHERDVLLALAARGLEAGRDVDVVALVSEDDEDAADAVESPLTAAHLQPREVSRRATTWLLDLLRDPSLPGELRLVAPRLVRGTSVRRHR